MALAWYSIPAKIGEQLATAVGRVSMVLYPLTGSYVGRDDRDSVVALYNAFLRLSLILSVIAVVIARTHGGEILHLWLRMDLSANAGSILLIAMLTALFRTPGTVAYHVANGLGKPGVPLLAGGIGATTSVIGAYLGAVYNGPVGAACGFLASAVLTNVAFDGVVRMRLLAVGTARWLDPYARTLLALIIAGIVSPALTASPADTMPLAFLKAGAAVVLSLGFGFCLGLLRIADIRLLLQKQSGAEPLIRDRERRAMPTSRLARVFPKAPHEHMRPYT